MPSPPSMHSGSSSRKRRSSDTRNACAGSPAVLRALPAWPAASARFPGRFQSQAFRCHGPPHGRRCQTFLEIANDSPYPIRLAGLLDTAGTATVEDLGRGLRLRPTAEAGGRNLVLDLLPYGVAAIRVGAPRVQLSSVTPYPSEAVLTTMQLRFNELSAQLGRLNHGMVAAPAEPPNPGFEPDPPLPDEKSPRAVKSDSQHARPKASSGAMALAGWRLEPNVAGTSTVAIDGGNAHLGQGSLKLTAPAAPSSVISESFVPNVQSSLDIEVFFRASAPGTKVRVWIEGESGGQALRSSHRAGCLHRMGIADGARVGHTRPRGSTRRGFGSS